MNHLINSEEKLRGLFNAQRAVNDKIKISLPPLIFISEITEVHGESCLSMILLKNGFAITKDKKYIIIMKRIGNKNPDNFYSVEHFDNYQF